MVVLDALTGRLKWYYQVTTDDDHDLDLGAAPMLYTMPDGRKMVVAAAKDGYVYVIDRRTHKLVFRTAVVPIKNAGVAPTPQGIDACPGALGGIGGNGAALDISNQALVVGAIDWCSTFKYEPREYKRGEAYFQGSFSMIGRPDGTITSLDSATGRIRWQFRPGAGVVAAITPTAGGLIFAGDLGGRFYALRSADGKVLRQIETGGALAGGIISYTVANNQYVAVASGNVSRATFGESGVPTIIIYGLGASSVTPLPSAPSFGSASASSGKLRYGQICAGCHGVAGEGSAGPKLRGIAARMSTEQTIEWIRNPRSERMPKLYPSQLSAQDTTDIAAYIQGLE